MPRSSSTAGGQNDTGKTRARNATCALSLYAAGRSGVVSNTLVADLIAKQREEWAHLDQLPSRRARTTVQRLHSPSKAAGSKAAGSKDPARTRKRSGKKINAAMGKNDGNDESDNSKEAVIGEHWRRLKEEEERTMARLAEMIACDAASRNDPFAPETI